MTYESLPQLINSSKDQYGFLLAEATELLRSLDTCGIDGYERAIARRQEYISEIQRIDNCLAVHLERVGTELSRDASDALAGFKTLKESATRKIMELDAIVIALTEERLKSLKGQIVAIKSGKSVFSSYERSGRRTPRDFKTTA